MNWVRKSVLARVQHQHTSEISGLNSDFSALERRVTELEAKLFNGPGTVPPTPRSTKGPDLSPLGNFKSTAMAADNPAPRELVRQEVTPTTPVQAAAPQPEPPSAGVASLTSLFGARPI